MALFHTTVVDNQIKALDTIGTASGAIATFETDKAENLVNLEVAITATQSGSGTPSPSNPRPINGFSACNLSVNGTTETIPFGQTVYGGRLNVGSGVLTVTHKIWATDGSETWNDGDNGDYYTTSHYSFDSMIGSSNGLSNYFTYNWSFSQINGCMAYNNRIQLTKTSYASIADMVADFANTPLQIVYPLATPTTIQLDSKQIQAIIGTNNIYADTGDIIDLKFVLSVGKAIS